ncbi:uncharacterized protein B0H64DRAFT_478472 [Chaetomium fimeti]|uniref:Uncharacterized protein n=1 Tax=Chaetomium fimeti TaxID=1854472 RepID=A0AAE0H732_9PEZI|nr:hypothetical protein B0H64DRAFT_478472 [Chaetomium fimeti]
MPSTAFFSVRISDTDPKTLIVLLEYIHKPTNIVLDCQKHTITLHPTESRATISVTSRGGVTASEDVVLSSDSVVCTDFLPRIFDNTVLPMYAISPDRVAIMMQPFAANIEGPERPLIKFEGGMFEEVFGGRIGIDADPRNEAADGSSGVDVFNDALARLFENARSVVWGTNQILRP